MQENDIPVTDDDRKAHEWADSPARQATEALAPIIRAIRAHVPVPALSDEWRDMLEKQDAGEVVSFSGLLARTVQMENDLAEARAEVERLSREREQQEKALVEHGRLLAEARAAFDEVENRNLDLEADLRESHAEVERLTAVAEDYGRRATAALTERDEARAEVTEWKRRTDHARAEVERLTAERLDRNPETKTRVESALSNLDQVEKVTVQKGAESNAETPDPADVKPGEAWKANIWYDGVHQPGTAIKSAGSSDWVVIRDDGSRSTFRMNEYVELVSRLVPGVTA